MWGFNSPGPLSKCSQSTIWSLPIWPYNRSTSRFHDIDELEHKENLVSQDAWLRIESWEPHWDSSARRWQRVAWCRRRKLNQNSPSFFQLHSLMEVAGEGVEWVKQPTDSRAVSYRFPYQNTVLFPCWWSTEHPPPFSRSCPYHKANFKSKDTAVVPGPPYRNTIWPLVLILKFLLSLCVISLLS